MIAFAFALAVFIVVCILVALLMDVAIRHAGFPPESKPIAIVVVILIGLVGIWRGGYFPW